MAPWIVLHEMGRCDVTYREVKCLRVLGDIIQCVTSDAMKNLFGAGFYVFIKYCCDISFLIF